MTLDYIRLHFNVPAYKGRRVRFNPGGLKPVEGVITGNYRVHLLVKPDGAKHSRPYHPTWKLEYL